MEKGKEVVVIDHSITVAGSCSDNSDFSVICSDNTENWHWVFDDDDKYSDFVRTILRDNISEVLVNSGALKDASTTSGSIRIKVTIESDIRQDDAE